ncbi:MAG TPA: hypothetical protein PLP31_04790 [Thermoanaerobaculaceae bacterium]|nr:hypothetical protein [Thermoanaerobaculaceae bacterium]
MTGDFRLASLTSACSTRQWLRGRAGRGHDHVHVQVVGGAGGRHGSVAAQRHRVVAHDPDQDLHRGAAGDRRLPAADLAAFGEAVGYCWHAASGERLRSGLDPSSARGGAGEATVLEDRRGFAIVRG